MLVAGDSVVFMRSSRGADMYVGVRRTVRASSGGDFGRWSSHIGLKSEEEGSGSDGFKTKLSAEAVAVAEAAEMAAQDMPFEVMYYPKAGWADFVVKADVVEKVFWTAGMRVKMAMETDDLVSGHSVFRLCSGEWALEGIPMAYASGYMG